tara:strand:- start:5653 stop:5829 length:177 start_codon:yes stop_codon:yes gene_type:complete
MNQSEKIILKCAEELLELSTALLQEVNKNKDHTKQIIAEIKDVEKYLKLLKEIYNVGS